MAHSVLPTTERATGWPTGHGDRSRPSVGCGAIHAAPVVAGWLHWRRAAHSGSPLADPADRRVAGSFHRAGSTWLANNVGSDESVGRLAADRIATCQARPVARGTRSPWTPTWTTNRSAGDHSR